MHLHSKSIKFDGIRCYISCYRYGPPNYEQTCSRFERTANKTKLVLSTFQFLKPSNTTKSANTCSVDHGNRSYSKYVCTNSNETFFLQKVSLLMLLKSVGALERDRVCFYLNTVFRRKPKERECPVPEEPNVRKST